MKLNKLNQTKHTYTHSLTQTHTHTHTLTHTHTHTHTHINKYIYISIAFGESINGPSHKDTHDLVVPTKTNSKRVQMKLY